jgi:hypothetical protein
MKLLSKTCNSKSRKMVHYFQNFTRITNHHPAYSELLPASPRANSLYFSCIKKSYIVATAGPLWFSQDGQ